jgi:hypothetical protein
MLIQVNSGYFSLSQLGHVRSGYFRLGQVISDVFKLCQVMSFYISLSGLFKLRLVWSG